VDDKKIIRWHPKFHVDDVPDVAEAELPQAPVVKTYNSAHDVLEKARDMIAPRVRRLHYISQNITLTLMLFWVNRQNKPIFEKLSSICNCASIESKN